MAVDEPSGLDAFYNVDVFAGCVFPPSMLSDFESAFDLEGALADVMPDHFYDDPSAAATPSAPSAPGAPAAGDEDDLPSGADLGSLVTMCSPGAYLTGPNAIFQVLICTSQYAPPQMAIYCKCHCFPNTNHWLAG